MAGRRSKALVSTAAAAALVATAIGRDHAWVSGSATTHATSSPSTSRYAYSYAHPVTPCVRRVLLRDAHTHTHTLSLTHTH
jgi:hypothetical protein